MISKLIKTWEFTTRERELTTLYSDKVRLNTESASSTGLQLSQQGFSRNSFPIYSTDSDLTIKTRMYEPRSLVSWEMLECIWDTNEDEYEEFSLFIKDKNVNEFAYDLGDKFPKVGDRVYQGNYMTTVADVYANKVVLADGTNFGQGNALFMRTKCDVQLRVYDKTGQEWYWDGSWQHAGPTDWNSTFVISNNISTFPLKDVGKGIGFLINLKTVDELYTPMVRMIKVLGSFDIIFQEDIIFGSLIPTMENEINATTEVRLQLASATDVIDLANEYKLERSDYNLTDGEIVYNETEDPHMTENVFDNYVPGPARKGGGNDPGQVHLNAVQGADSIMTLKMKYFPEIAVNTSIDFYEVNRVPSIVFERIEQQNTMVDENSEIGKDSIRDKLTLTGVELKPPAQSDLLIEYAVFTGGQTDQHYLGEALRRLFNNLKHITSWGLDEPFSIIVRDVFRSTNQPNASGVNTHVGSITIKNVISSIGEPNDVYLVGNLGRGMTTKQT